MNFFSRTPAPTTNNITPPENPPAKPEETKLTAPPREVNNPSGPIYPSLPLKVDLDKECEYPSSMEHSTTSSRTNTAGSWFSSTTIGFAGGAPADGDNNGEQTPNQQRIAAARRLLDLLRQRLRPWTSEFFNFGKFGWPPSVVGVVPRIKHNLQYFMTNYLCIVIVLLIYCILTSFLTLLALIILGGLLYTVYTRTQQGPVVLGGYEIPPSLLYTLAVMVCFPMFALANVGELMYWLVGSSFFVILVHTTFYCSEEVPGAEFEVVNVVTT